ncbi:MAG: hypothetical protein R3F62_26785 [Planctomycetota bacterium]
MDSLIEVGLSALRELLQHSAGVATTKKKPAKKKPAKKTKAKKKPAKK